MVQLQLLYSVDKLTNLLKYTLELHPSLKLAFEDMLYNYNYIIGMHMHMHACTDLKLHKHYI